jgi:hypothetical protein
MKRKSRRHANNDPESASNEGNRDRIDLQGSADTSDAYQVALELMKQLITLASGVLALSATFIEKFGVIPRPALLLLGLSWLSLVLSVFFGLETISAIVKSRLNPTQLWSEGRGKHTAIVCKYSFVVGIFLFAGFAILTLAKQHANDARKPFSSGATIEFGIPL